MSKPFIIIKLDKPRKLKLTMGAAIEFEQITRKHIMNMTQDDYDMETVTHMLRAQLLGEEPTLTLETVQKIYDDYAESYDYVVEKMGEAIQTFAHGKKSPNVILPTAESETPNT